MSLLRQMRLSALVAGVVVLAGCSTVARQTVARGEKIDADATVHIAATAKQGDRPPYFERVDDFYIASAAIESQATQELPDVFGRTVYFTRDRAQTLNDIAEYVNTTYGVAVDVTDDAIAQAAATVYDPVPATLRRQAEILALEAQAQGQMMGAGGGAMPMQGNQTNKALDGAFVLAYTGKLKDFLDQVALRTGNSWRYQRGRVLIFNTDTQIFKLSMQVGETGMSSSSSGTNSSGASGGGGEGGGGGGQSSLSGDGTVSTSASTNIFSETIDALKSMLSSRGKLSALPGVNAVSVTDVPAVLSRVGAYVDSLNSLATRQVQLDIQVYAIEVTGNDSFGVRLDGLWRSLNSGLHTELLSGAGPATGASTLSTTLVDPGSAYNGTSVLIDALSKLGNMQQITSYNATTVAGRPVPINATEQFAYQDSAQTTLVPDVGSQTTRHLATSTTGFLMRVVPTITSDNRVALSMRLDLTALRELRRVGSEESGDLTEAPQTSQRLTEQSTIVRSGETLVISGFEQETNRLDKQGVGTAGFMLLGGNRATEQRRSKLVVLVTPRIVG